jgi:hypothetical protein
VMNFRSTRLYMFQMPYCLLRAVLRRACLCVPCSSTLWQVVCRAMCDTVGKTVCSIDLPTRFQGRLCIACSWVSSGSKRTPASMLCAGRCTVLQLLTWQRRGSASEAAGHPSLQQSARHPLASCCMMQKTCCRHSLQSSRCRFRHPQRQEQQLKQ